MGEGKVPESRIACRRALPVNPAGQFVLYWMIGQRRMRWNFAVDRALEWSRELGRPLLVFEPLRHDYRWASPRLHRFVIEGMRDNARDCKQVGVTYFPYVEPSPGAARGLLSCLAQQSCVVITDEFPSFFLPHMVTAAVDRCEVRCEQVDSIGLLPLSSSSKIFQRAVDFRRFVQRKLPEHWAQIPQANALAPRAPLPAAVLPLNVLKRWPRADLDHLLDGPGLAELHLAQNVGAVGAAGGARAAEKTLRAFIERKLPRYADDRNQPEVDAASGLSPYLHFGHIAAHQVAHDLLRSEGWNADRLVSMGAGHRAGWWRASPAAEAFLDQLVTWRELGFHFAARHPHHDQFDSLPPWALTTLEKHRRDPRPDQYSLSQFEAAATHDALWNAAQTQLLREGQMHNYLRMLWGKKILEWSPTPEQALATMIELNNKHALDGRDPNSYSGIFWVLGRFDRPWAPERPIFGTLRYMSSSNTARKLRVRQYLAQYSPTVR